MTVGFAVFAFQMPSQTSDAVSWFAREMLPRIRELRGLLPEEILIQVDGGVGAANIGAINEAGASLLVAGSAVFAHGDLAASYQGLVQALR